MSVWLQVKLEDSCLNAHSGPSRGSGVYVLEVPTWYWPLNFLYHLFLNSIWISASQQGTLKEILDQDSLFRVPYCLLSQETRWHQVQNPKKEMVGPYVYFCLSLTMRSEMTFFSPSFQSSGGKWTLNEVIVMSTFMNSRAPHIFIKEEGKGLLIWHM